MTHPSEYIKELLKKHIEGRASAAEIETLLAELDLYDKEAIKQMIDEIDPEINLENVRNSKLKAPSFKKLREHINRNSSSKIKTPVKRIIGNAAIYIGGSLLFLAFLWFIGRPPKLQYSCGDLRGNSEIPTGSYTCKLLLNSRCSILIDSAYKGLVAKQGNTEIIKLQSGVLLYKRLPSGSANDTSKWMFNTVTTSAGDQYQVILPDGTKVRLNAATSIRFPVVFSDTERVVMLEGEAFFEVATDRKTPFCVKVRNSQIRALGTCFNVNAYSKNTIATLLCGDLEVKNNRDSVRLISGQEAIVSHEPSNSAGRISVNVVDTTKAVSWKKVMRIYKDIPLKDFISDIGRWYNLEMLNTGCVPDSVISVTLCYDTPVEEILKLLRANGLHFKQEGRKIIFCTQSE